MYTRITDQIMFNSAKDNINTNLRKLYELQLKASDGKKYLRASENPAVAAKGLSLRSTQSKIESYQSTLSTTKAWMDMVDESLSQMNDVLDSAVTDVLQALNGTLGEDEKEAIAQSLNGYLETLIDIANTNYDGNYFFSGLKTDTKPFAIADSTSGSGELVDQLQVNLSVASDSSGSIILNGFLVDYDTTSPETIELDGHTISINSPTLSDGSLNTDYPTFYVDGTAVIPNPTTGSSISFEGQEITVDYTSGSPAFSVDGTSITSSGSTLIQTSSSIPIIYTSGSMLVNGSEVTSVSGSPNTYYISGMEVSVDTTTGSPVYVIDGNVLDLASDGYDYLDNVTKHNGGVYGTDPDFPVVYRDKVLYYGDSSTVSRSISFNQDMSISMDGGSTFNQVNGMFDTIIKLRDALLNDDYLSPQTLTYSNGTVSYQVAQDIDTTENDVGAISTTRNSTAYIDQSPTFKLLSEAYGQLREVSDNIANLEAVVGTKLKNIGNAQTRCEDTLVEIKSQLSDNEEISLADATSDVNLQTIVYNSVINMSSQIESLTTLFDRI